MTQRKNQLASTQILLLLITLTAGIIRFINLAGDSFWFDEILTINVARLGWQAILSVPDHPPLLYIFTAFWVQNFGVNEFAARLTSAIAGTISVGLLGWWGITTERQRVGILAATLLALSPFHLRYSQEARHYALLMLFSLLMLVCLHLAITRMNWRWWISFATATLLNMYTHYSAILVLLASSTIILIWFIRQLKWSTIKYPLMAAAIIFLGYLFWMPHFFTAFIQNRVQETGIAQTGSPPTPLAIWLKNAFFEFGFRGNMLPVLTLALFAIGLIILFLQRDWLLISIIGLLILLPFAFINIAQISRYAFPKYVIYMLPFYLLSAAITLDKLLQSMIQRFSSIKPIVLYLIMAELFLSALLPQLNAEYLYIERDWRGALESIASEIKPGDIFIPITLDLNQPFNQGSVLLTHYLDQTIGDYLILDGTNLSNLDQISFNQSANVWVFALNRIGTMNFDNSLISAHEFSGKLFVITAAQSTSYEQISSIYNAFLPVTLESQSKCRVMGSIARVNIASGEWDFANENLIKVRQLCSGHDHQYAEMQYIIDKGMMYRLIDEGKQLEAIEIASRLWQIDRKDKELLEVLSVYDFIQHFDGGDGQVVLNEAPEAIDVRRFVMPQNGDWGDVLFVHPPAALSFDITLPTDGTSFYVRVAMAPESWAYGGDGSTFVVTLLSNNREFELLREHISNDPDDQRWHSFTIPLEQFKGEQVTLTLATEGGLAGDTTGDWAGFESPQIIWQP